MPHLYSDEQNQIREQVRRALFDLGSKDRLRALLEKKGCYDVKFQNVARELEWNAIGISEADGGLGLGLIELLIVAEECGRALVAAPLLASAVPAIHVLTASGNPGGILGKIAAGTLVATFAVAEATEVFPTRIATTFEDGHITGRKRAVLSGAVADQAIVLAADTEGRSRMVLVDLNQTGVERVVLETIDNSRCIADLKFNHARATLLDIEEPHLVALQALARLALFLASESVGGTDGCIALARDYANERQAFGQAIGKFQAVKHAIAEMWVLNELARASVLDAAVRLSNDDADAEAYVAAARLNAIQAYETAAATATQIHGGIGVAWEADLHLHYRRARSFAVEGGVPAYWEDRLVENLVTT
jgi:alkylation response protein AidB-like acyl-CoA dehydrogenase